jgi:hypothetical protein
VFDIPVAPAVKAVDNCDGDVPVEFTENQASGLGNIRTKYIRQWKAQDSSGQTSVIYQTVSVIDADGPMIEGVDDDVTVECDKVPPRCQVTGYDVCDGAVSVTALDAKIVHPDPNKQNNYVITYAWEAKDSLGRTTQESQVVTVQDFTKPKIIGVTSGTVSISCADIGDASVEDVTVIDNCDDDFLASFNGVKEGNDFIRSWTAQDSSGNYADMVVQTVTIYDDECPVLLGVEDDIEVSNVDMIPEPCSVIAVDNCDDSPTITYSEVIEGEDNKCIDKIKRRVIRTWSAIDESGQECSKSRTITVKDETPPTFYNLPATSITVDCENIPTFSVSAKDDYNDNLKDNSDYQKITPELEGDISNKVKYTAYYTWKVEDKCGNSVTHVTTVTVTDDTPPILLNIPGDLETVDCGSDVSITPQVLASDNCPQCTDLVVSYESNTIETQSGSCGNYKVRHTWTATDCAGNKATHSQMVIVSDTEAPTPSTVFDTNDITKQCDETPNINLLCPKRKYIDNCDTIADVTPSVKTVPRTCENEFAEVCEYIAEDQCGNSVTHYQTIVVEDTKAPQLTGSSATTVTIQCDELGLLITDSRFYLHDKVIDNCDDSLSYGYNTNEINMHCEYHAFSYEETHTYTDDCGNSLDIVRTINVVDTKSPDALNDKIPVKHKVKGNP